MAVVYRGVYVTGVTLEGLSQSSRSRVQSSTARAARQANRTTLSSMPYVDTGRRTLYKHTTILNRRRPCA
jgi:hypothetical protein